MSLNKVMIIGNAGKDPEVVQFQDGGKTAKFTLAATERYTDRSGQQQQRTEWFNVVVNGRTADVVERYVRKGSQLYVEGRLQTRKYQAKDGSERYVTEVACLTLQLLGSPQQQQQQQPAPQPQYQPQPMPGQYAPQPQQPQYRQPMPQQQQSAMPLPQGPAPQAAQQQYAPQAAGQQQYQPQPTQPQQGPQGDDLPF